MISLFSLMMYELPRGSFVGVHIVSSKGSQVISMNRESAEAQHASSKELCMVVLMLLCHWYAAVHMSMYAHDDDDEDDDDADVRVCKPARGH